jgi:ABC-type sugar transport system permease subunit
VRGRDISRYPIQWLFPVLLIVITFTVFPFGYAIYNSLFRIILVLPTQPFIGLKNYAQVFTSVYFREALVNTLVFMAITAPIIVVVSLGVGRLLLTHFVGRGIIRAVVLLPWAIPGAISGILWYWIFQEQWGILNTLLIKLHIITRGIEWLDNRNLAKFSTMIAHIWTQIPFASVLLMAALTTINKELYEAAEVDGAGPLRRLLHVTLPQVAGMMGVAFIYELIMCLTTYDVTYSMTSGGPGGATTLLSYFIWAESFSQLNFGRGAALGVIVALITLGLIMLILKAIPSGMTLEEE